MSRPPIRKRWTPSSSARAWKASFPALEPSTRWPMSTPRSRRPAEGPSSMVMNMCGRGDKDIFTVAEALGDGPRGAATVMAGRIDGASPRCAEGRGGLRRLRHGRRPGTSTSQARSCGPSGVRRRPDRDRHAFTDPMADGPAIQASPLRALAKGQTRCKTLEMVRDFRRRRQRNADRSDGLLQPHLHLTASTPLSPTPRRPASMA